MKRKDADEVNGDVFDFALSSPALKIRRLDAELAPIINEQEALNSMEFGQSMPYRDNFVEHSMENSPIAIDELSHSVPLNEERAIVLFNPMNNTPSLQPSTPFSITTDSDFLSRFKNPVIWSNGSDDYAPKSTADETQKQGDDSGMFNGCLAVVPWVPSHSQHPSTAEFTAPAAQTSDMMDSDAMEVEDDHNTQQSKHHHATTSATQDWNQWQQHCMVQQPPSNFSTPISWLGAYKSLV